MLGALQTGNDAVDDVDFLFDSFDAFGDASAFRQFEGFVNDFEVEFEVFAIGYALDGEGDVFVNLLAVVGVAEQHGETFDCLVTMGDGDIVALRSDLSPVVAYCELFAFLAVASFEHDIFGDSCHRILLG